MGNTKRMQRKVGSEKTAMSRSKREDLEHVAMLLAAADGIIGRHTKDVDWTNGPEDDDPVANAAWLLGVAQMAIGEALTGERGAFPYLYLSGMFASIGDPRV